MKKSDKRSAKIACHYAKTTCHYSGFLEVKQPLACVLTSVVVKSYV
jgi:hypothetical protein